MFYVYILQSKQTSRYYIGQTDNISLRLKRHQSGETSFGKRNNDVCVVYQKEFLTRSDAVKFELFLKKQKSHKFIDRLISGNVVLR